MLLASGVASAALLGALPSKAETLYLLTEDGLLSTVSTSAATAPTAGLAITGVTAGEVLVAIDVRPQNQQLYALGVNNVTDKATLYLVEPSNGVATPVGTAGQIAFTTNGTLAVDLPDPSAVKWGMDFNPANDQLRVVAGGLNFRVNPNTGGGFDGNNGLLVAVTGTNPDGTTNGGTTTVNSVAHTNSQPNSAITTLYTLDDTTNSLYIQNLATNAATQASGQVVTVASVALDFLQSSFDIAPGVNAAANNTAVTAGTGFFVAKLAGGTSKAYSLNLVNAQATLLGDIGLAVRSIAIKTDLGAAVALNSAGTSLLRFNPATPGTTTPAGVTGITAGETLVGIDTRPQTGQLIGLGINATANTGTLYIVDPQTGGLTTIGTAGSIAFVDSTGAVVDLPDPAAGYGFDVNPTVDRIRVITGTGLNFRINPSTGAPVDGDAGSATPVTGTNPDAGQNGLAASSTGATGAAYTNNIAQSLTGGATTLYTIDTTSGSLYIQNAPNAGTQTTRVPITVGGTSPTLVTIGGFDIPGSVSVAASNAVAVGEGWFVATIGGTTGLYRIDLTTGKATSFGAVGAGTGLAGLAIFSVAPDLSVQKPAETLLVDNATTIDFGTTYVGTPVTQTVVLRNVSSQPVTYSTTFDTGTSFSSTINGSGVIPGSSSTVLTLTFSPAATGTLNDTLHIISNDADLASFEIALTGKGFIHQSDDNALSTNGPTRLNVLANDTLPGTLTITAVSNPAIVIDGRALIIPSNFVGTFTYTISNGTILGQSTVTISANVPTTAPTTFNGVLLDSTGKVAGWAKASVSTRGSGSVRVVTANGNGNGKVTFPVGTTLVTTPTSLGTLTVDQAPGGDTGVYSVSLAQTGGGTLTGTLHAESKVATATTYHIGLASLDSSLAGGGYITASLTRNASVRMLGVLPDGNSFTGNTIMADNESIAFFLLQQTTKPVGVFGGTLTLGNNATTDVTGELVWSKPSGGTKGTERGGVNTTLLANGSIFDSTVAPFSGAATLEVAGGNLVADESNFAVFTNGIPTLPVGSLQVWKAYPNLGTFKFTVFVPTLNRAVAGSGLYLQKSNSAVGYFSGSTSGGRVVIIP